MQEPVNNYLLALNAEDCLLLRSIYDSRLGFQMLARPKKRPKNPTMLSWEVAISIIHYFMVSQT